MTRSPSPASPSHHRDGDHWLISVRHLQMMKIIIMKYPAGKPAYRGSAPPSAPCHQSHQCQSDTEPAVSP